MTFAFPWHFSVLCRIPKPSISPYSRSRPYPSYRAPLCHLYLSTFLRPIVFVSHSLYGFLSGCLNFRGAYPATVRILLESGLSRCSKVGLLGERSNGILLEWPVLGMFILSERLGKTEEVYHVDICQALLYCRRSTALSNNRRWESYLGKKARHDRSSREGL